MILREDRTVEITIEIKVVPKLVKSDDILGISDAAPKTLSFSEDWNRDFGAKYGAWRESDNKKNSWNEKVDKRNTKTGPLWESGQGDGFILWKRSDRRTTIVPRWWWWIWSPEMAGINEMRKTVHKPETRMDTNWCWLLRGGCIRSREKLTVS